VKGECHIHLFLFVIKINVVGQNGLLEEGEDYLMLISEAISNIASLPRLFVLVVHIGECFRKPLQLLCILFRYW